MTCTPPSSPSGSSPAEMQMSPAQLADAMESSPLRPAPAVKLRLQYPAFPLPCPVAPLHLELDETLRSNAELKEALDQSRAAASKLRVRVKAMEKHTRELQASVTAQVRTLRKQLQNGQHEMVRQMELLLETLRVEKMDLARLKVERRLRYTRERERDEARQTAAELSLALSKAEAQLELQNKQLDGLRTKVDAHAITRTELGEALQLAKAKTTLEKKAAGAAVKAAAKATSAAEELRLVKEQATAERDEAKGHAAAAERLAESVAATARSQHEELEATIAGLAQQRWQFSSLPERRNWGGIAPTSERVYRACDINALIEIFTAREWRPAEIATALAKSWYGDSDPFILGVFNADEMWTLRLGWLRQVFDDMRHHHWNVDLAIELRTSAPHPISNAQMDSLRHKFGSTYNAETDSHERKRLLCHPNHPNDIVYMPYPVETRSSWVPAFHILKEALSVGLDTSGNLASRRLRDVVEELVLEDYASGALPAHVGASAEGDRLQLNILMDGFPLDKQSIEHLCIANCSMPEKFSIHSEAMLKCVTVGRMSESNASLLKLYAHNGLGDDANALIKDGFIDVCASVGEREEMGSTKRCHLELTCTADRKAIEANVGCGPCSVWDRCPKDLQHKLPWARSAAPPASIDEYRQKKQQLGVTGFLTWDDSTELGHGLFPGENLPRRCRVCAKKPYATVAEYMAAKLRCERLKGSSVKKEQALYKRERATYAALHWFQHEFCQPALHLGMSSWIPELMHVLELNCGYLQWKHCTLKHCDAFCREMLAVFLTGLGAPLDTRKKEDGRAKADRWFKASTWDALVLGSNKFPGGLSTWYPCVVLLITDCFRDARDNGGVHTSAANVAAAAAAAAPPPPRPAGRGFDVRDDSDDEDVPIRRPPPRAPARAPAQPTASAPLTLQQLLTRDLGNSMAENVLLMLSSMDTYNAMHTNLRSPLPMVDDPAHEDRAEWALNIAITSVACFHDLEESNPSHRSAMPHTVWAVVPEFVMQRGNIWRYSSGKLEARGAVAKRLGRGVVCWRNFGTVSTRGVKKRALGTKKSRKKFLAVLDTEKAVTTTWKTSGCKQLLEMLGLREKRLRVNPHVSRASSALSKFGRIKASRHTIKHENAQQKAHLSYTCKQLFEKMYRGQLKRLYSNLGIMQLEAWNALVGS